MAKKTTWQIDPAHSTIELAVKHMMFTTVRGRFKSFSGTITVDEQNPDLSTVEVEIDATSLDTGVEDRDRHLRSADFLDAETYPTITFHSKKVRGAHAEPGDHFQVVGDLTIRGTPIEVTLDAVFEGMGQDMQGKQRTGFGASGEIDRRDWGLVWNQALETGGILVGNTIRVELEVQAVEQAAGQREAA